MSDPIRLIIPEGMADTTAQDALDALTSAGFIVSHSDGFDSADATAFDATPARFDGGDE